MALRAENVTRQFFRKRGASNVFNAVENVSVTLENKEITVITGPSGSGKSTLLNMMAGILAPTEGKITVSGADLYSMDDEALSAFRNARIGVIPQGQTALHSLTVRDNILLPFVLLGRKRRAKEKINIPEEDGIQKRADGLMDRTGITDLADIFPSEISGGEQRRMAIVRAMLLKPDVILADEPTADLDEENTKAVLSLMRYAADEGSAVLIVTHDKDVLPEANRIYRMRDGKLEQ